MLMPIVATALPLHAASFSMKRGINLDTWTTWPPEDRWGEADVILPFPEWRKSMDADSLAALKAAGFDFVRMPVDPSPFLSGRTEGLRDRLVSSVVESARLINKSGLKVVVDLHLFPAGSNRSVGMREVMDDPEMFDRYVELVRTMAHALANEDPALVAFEPMNEPVVDCEDDHTNLWPDRLQRLYAAARASATRLTIVLTGACYSGAEALAKINPKAIPDDNIIWTFHSYDPFLLTHQGATWAGDFIQYVTGLPFPLDAVPRSELDAVLETIRQRIRDGASWSRRQGMLDYLDEQVATIDTTEKLDEVMDRPFEIATKWARANGIDPKNIFLGEFGMIREEYGNPYVMPVATRASYVKDMIGRAERHGFAWSVWSYGGAFGVVEQFDNKPAEPEVMEMMKRLP